MTYTAPGTYALSVERHLGRVLGARAWPRRAARRANCKPVPGAAGLAASTSPPHQVAVREIQSVNNG